MTRSNRRRAAEGEIVSVQKTGGEGGYLARLAARSLPAPAARAAWVAPQTRADAGDAAEWPALHVAAPAASALRTLQPVPVPERVAQEQRVSPPRMEAPSRAPDPPEFQTAARRPVEDPGRVSERLSAPVAPTVRAEELMPEPKGNHPVAPPNPRPFAGIDLADAFMSQFVPARRVELPPEEARQREESEAREERTASPASGPAVVREVIEKVQVQETRPAESLPATVLAPMPAPQWAEAARPFEAPAPPASSLEIGRITVEIVDGAPAAPSARPAHRSAARRVRTHSGPPPSIHRFRGGF